MITCSAEIYFLKELLDGCLGFSKYYSKVDKRYNLSVKMEDNNDECEPDEFEGPQANKILVPFTTYEVTFCNDNYDDFIISTESLDSFFLIFTVQGSSGNLYFKIIIILKLLLIAQFGNSSFLTIMTEFVDTNNNTYYVYPNLAYVPTRPIPNGFQHMIQFDPDTVSYYFMLGGCGADDCFDNNDCSGENNMCNCLKNVETCYETAPKCRGSNRNTWNYLCNSAKNNQGCANLQCEEFPFSLTQVKMALTYSLVNHRVKVIHVESHFVSLQKSIRFTLKCIHATKINTNLITSKITDLVNLKSSPLTRMEYSSKMN
jgi:hypothetical protein